MLIFDNEFYKECFNIGNINFLVVFVLCKVFY